MRPDIEFLGDAALLLRFGAHIDPAVNDAVLAAAERLREAALPGILDVVPAYASLTVCYDPGVWWAGELRAHIAALSFPAAARPAGGAEVQIPVCYEPEFAPDLDAVCAHTGLDAAEVVCRHQAVAYRVYFVGFVPGFPYLGELDPALHVPRRATPRREVPAGSVAIGGGQTGIYPLVSPGGWQLIGRTPLALFDAAREPACLLRAGDRVRFVAVTREEFRRIRATAAGIAT